MGARAHGQLVRTKYGEESPLIAHIITIIITNIMTIITMGIIRSSTIILVIIETMVIVMVTVMVTMMVTVMVTVMVNSCRRGMHHVCIRFNFYSISTVPQGHGGTVRPSFARPTISMTRGSTATHRDKKLRAT